MATVQNKHLMLLFVLSQIKIKGLGKLYSVRMGSDSVVGRRFGVGA